MSREADASLEAFMLAAPGGDRFCVYRGPPGGVRGAVVHVHAFAEEMNRARMSVAAQARALARAGFAVLTIDLAGCGDSAGELADVTWEDWATDVEAALGWLRRRHPGRPWLWALRAGALVAVEAIRRSPDVAGLLAVQPPASGEQVLRQFLRLGSAMGMAQGGGVAAGDLRQRLAAGDSVEVAGYVLGAKLADGLARSVMTLERPSLHAACVELGSGTELSPAAARILEQWRGAGLGVSARTLDAPQFWQSMDPAGDPGIADALIDIMERA